MKIGGGYGFTGKITVEGESRGQVGACFGALISMFKYNSPIKKGAVLSSLQITTPKSSGQDMTPEQFHLWANAGKKMFGWDLSESVLKEAEACPISLGMSLLHTAAYFQACWYRLPFEGADPFVAWAKEMQGLPKPCHDPFHPTFWLAYLKAACALPYSYGHEFIPQAGPYSTALPERVGSHASVNIDKQKDVVVAVAMAEYAEKQISTKTVNLTMKDVMEAKSDRSGYDPLLWDSIFSLVPARYRKKLILVPPEGLLDKTTRSITKRGYSFLDKMLEEKATTERSHSEGIDKIIVNLPATKKLLDRLKKNKEA